MKRPLLMSLYSGAGGLDYGFEAAGFETGVCVEFDAHCCETLRVSRPGWSVIERSIFDVPTSEMLACCDRSPGEVDLLIGGPPCQPFSKAGYWARGDSMRLNDPRASTLDAYLRVLEEARPRAFLLENVEGLTFAGKDEGLRLLLDGIAAINTRTGSDYKPTLAVLNTASYGVPQLRERVFIIGSRDGKEFRFPAATHRSATDKAPTLLDELCPTESFRNAWDAIGDLAPLPGEDLAVRGKWADLLPSIPEGNNYLWHTERGGGRPLFGWRRRYWTFLLKLAKDRPSWTIQAQPGPAVGPFHWENRRLSTRELCRLQTFPEDVRIQGPRIAIQRQVGNAVPSLMGEVLGRAIRTQLLGLAPLRRPLALLPKQRQPVPAPEPLVDVPARYHAMQGVYEAHPGTGKGYRASNRATEPSPNA